MTPTHFIFLFARAKSNFFFAQHNFKKLHTYLPHFFWFCHIKIYFQFHIFFFSLSVEIILIKSKSTSRTEKFVKSNLYIFFSFFHKLKNMYIPLHVFAKTLFLVPSQKNFVKSKYIYLFFCLRMQEISSVEK